MEKQLLISDSLKDQIPPFVLAELAKMPAVQQDQFVQEFNRKGKSPTVGLVLAIFGLHYLYLGKFGTFLIYFFTMGAMGFWWLIDIIRIKKVIGESNKDVSIEIMRNMKAVM